MSQPSQAQILAALQSSSFRPRQPLQTKLYADIPNTADILIHTPGPSTNARKVYCFREGCGSLILVEDAAEWVELTEPVLPDDTASPFPPPPAGRLGAWHVLSPFNFENVGYSRPDSSTTLPLSAPGVASSSASFPPEPHSQSNLEDGTAAVVPKTDIGGESRPSMGTELQGKVKWLICAECDLGPIGWGFEGGTEAWVVAERVRYGA